MLGVFCPLEHHNLHGKLTFPYWTSQISLEACPPRFAAAVAGRRSKQLAVLALRLRPGITATIWSHLPKLRRPVSSRQADRGQSVVRRRPASFSRTQNLHSCLQTFLCKSEDLGPKFPLKCGTGVKKKRFCSNMCELLAFHLSETQRRRYYRVALSVKVPKGRRWLLRNRDGEMGGVI